MKNHLLFVGLHVQLFIDKTDTAWFAVLTLRI